MTKNEFNRAFEIAQNNNISLLDIDNSILYGCALPEFKYPVHCTIIQLAALIRWQCQYLFGGWDSEELDSIAYIAKKKFILVD